MKRLLLILCLGSTVNLSQAQTQNAQQSVQDKHHTVLGYIRAGVITNAENAVIGNFKPSASGVTTISGKNQSAIGYMVQNSEIQDASHKTIGYIVPDGKGVASVTVTDAQRKTIGHINADNGSVTDNLGNLLGYEVNTEVSWAAPYFFFFKSNF